MTKHIRVLVADDHAVVRSGLRALFDTVDEIEVVGEAGDGQAAVDLTDELLPDVVLMDVQMPGVDGIEATRRITAAHPSVAVVVLTMYEDSDTLFAALRAGARGYLLKGAEQTDVLHCLRSVAAGHVTLGPGAAERVLEEFSAGAPARGVSRTDRSRTVGADPRGRGAQQHGHRRPARARQQDGREPRVEHPHQAAVRRPRRSHRASTQSRPH